MAFYDITVLSILKSFNIYEKIGTKTFQIKEGSGKSESFFTGGRILAREDSLANSFM